MSDQYVCRRKDSGKFVETDCLDAGLTNDLQQAFVASKTGWWLIISHDYRKFYELCPVTVSVYIEGDPIAF